MDQLGPIVKQVFFELNTDDLIETFQYDPEDHIQKHCPEVVGGGILVSPSAFGAELYLWGFGIGDTDFSHILNDKFEDLADVPLTKNDVIRSSKKHNKKKQMDAYMRYCFGRYSSIGA